MKKLTSVIMLFFLLVTTNAFAQQTGSVTLEFSRVNENGAQIGLVNVKGAVVRLYNSNEGVDSCYIAEYDSDSFTIDNLISGEYYFLELIEYPLGYERWEEDPYLKEDFGFSIDFGSVLFQIPCQKVEGIFTIKAINRTTGEPIEGISFDFFSDRWGVNKQLITNAEGKADVEDFDYHYDQNLEISCLNFSDKYLVSGSDKQQVFYLPYNTPNGVLFVFDESPSLRLGLSQRLILEKDEFENYGISYTTIGITDYSGIILDLYDENDNLLKSFNDDDIQRYFDGWGATIYYPNVGNYRLRVRQSPHGFIYAENQEFCPVSFSQEKPSYSSLYFTGINTLNIQAIDVGTNASVEDAVFRANDGGETLYKKTTDRFGKTTMEQLSYLTNSINCVSVPMGYRLVGEATQTITFGQSATPATKDVTYYFEQVGPTQNRDTCSMKINFYRAINQPTIYPNGQSMPVQQIDHPFGSVVRLYDDTGVMVARVDYDEQYANGLQTNYLLFENVRAGTYYAKVEKYPDLLERFTDCLDSRYSLDSLICSTGRYIDKGNEWHEPRWQTGVGSESFYVVGRNSISIKALDYNTQEPVKDVWFSAYSEKYGLFTNNNSYRTTNENGELSLKYQTSDTYKVVNDSCPESYRVVGDAIRLIEFEEGNPSLKELTYYFVKIKEMPTLLGHVQLNASEPHMYSVKTGQTFKVNAWLSDATDTGIGLYDQNGNFLENITVSRSGSVYTCMVSNRSGSLMISPFYIDEMGENKPIVRPENSYLIDNLPLTVEIDWGTRSYAVSDDVNLSKSMRIRTSVNNLHRVENDEAFRLSLSFAPTSADVQIGLFDLMGNFQENVLQSKSGTNFTCSVSWDIWGDNYIIMPYILENGTMKIIERTDGAFIIDRLPLYVDDGFGTYSYSTRSALGLEDNEGNEVTISVYPNPVIDKLNISTSENISQVKVFDMNSKLMLSIDNSSSEVDLSSLPKGVYILKVITEDSPKSFRIIKD